MSPIFYCIFTKQSFNLKKYIKNHIFIQLFMSKKPVVIKSAYLFLTKKLNFDNVRYLKRWIISGRIIEASLFTEKAYAHFKCQTPQYSTFHLKFYSFLSINFERYLKILWKNNSALFNMTHHMKVGPSSNLTNGVVMIEFPVASQHIGKLVYGYEVKLLFCYRFLWCIALSFQ